MPTAPIIEPEEADSELEQILSDPKVRASLEALDDPEDRQDLLDALIVRKRIAEGKEKTYSLEEFKQALELAS